MWKSLVKRVSRQKMKIMKMIHKVPAHDVIEEDEELFHSVIRIPSDYVNGAKITIESIYGGAIRNIKIHTHTSDVAVKYAYVSFESYEVTSRALSTKHFWPNGELIVITRDPEPSPEACQASHFDVLNHDCLLHLYQYLDPVDIAQASEAFQCLSQFATENIYHKYATMDIFEDRYCEIPKTYVFNEFKNVFKHFGEYVTHCYINANQLKNPTITHIRAILQYCPNLDHIEFEHCTFGPHDLESLCNEPLRATKAHFNKCRISANNWSALWTKWRCLRALTMTDLHFGLIGDHFLDGLSNLEKLSFEYCTDIKYTTLLDALDRSRTTMTTCAIVCSRMDHHLYHYLFDFAPNLGHLVVKVSHPKQISQLHKLNNLKRLKLIIMTDTPYTSWSEILESFQTLVELDVDMSNASTVEMSAAMPTLQVLRIRFPRHGYLDIFEIVSNLPKLKQLYLSNCSSRWNDVDTVQLLESNNSIEEMFLEYCFYGSTSFSMLANSLIKQAHSMEFPRPKVRLTIRKYFRQHQDCDHQLDKTEFKPIFQTFKINEVLTGHFDPDYSGDYACDQNNWRGRILSDKLY